MRTLVLVGSGEFTESMIEADKYLLGLTKKPNSVAIIPTASVPDNKEKEWIEKGVKHFKKLGIKSKGVNIKNRNDANKREYLETLESASLIYFSGGHPGYLYKVFENTKAGNLILDQYVRGITLVGSSAGAMILGNYLLSNAQEAFAREEKPEWLSGFNLVNYAILPHYDWVIKYKSTLLRKIMNSASKKIKENWLGIDEDTAIIINEVRAKILGRGTVTVNSNNELSLYKPGDKFLLEQIEAKM